MTRPEASGGSDYERQLGDSLDAEFTPWRPGDPTTAGDAPSWDTTAHQVEQPRWGVGSDRVAEQGTSNGHAADESRQTRGGRWWTEDNPRRLTTGERVRTTRATGDGLFTTVRPGTTGRITSTETSLFGTERATVEFDNGYTEEVRTEHLERRGWLD